MVLKSDAEAAHHGEESPLRHRPPTRTSNVYRYDHAETETATRTIDMNPRPKDVASRSTCKRPTSRIARWKPHRLARPVSGQRGESFSGSCIASLNLEAANASKACGETASSCSTCNVSIVAKRLSETVTLLLHTEAATGSRSASLNLETPTVQNPPVEGEAARSTRGSPTPRIRHRKAPLATSSAAKASPPLPRLKVFCRPGPSPQPPADVVPLVSIPPARAAVCLGAFVPPAGHGAWKSPWTPAQRIGPRLHHGYASPLCPAADLGGQPRIRHEQVSLRLPPVPV